MHQPTSPGEKRIALYAVLYHGRAPRLPPPRIGLDDSDSHVGPAPRRPSPIVTVLSKARSRSPHVLRRTRPAGGDPGNCRTPPHRRLAGDSLRHFARRLNTYGSLPIFGGLPRVPKEEGAASTGPAARLGASPAPRPSTHRPVPCGARVCRWFLYIARHRRALPGGGSRGWAIGLSRLSTLPG